MSTLVSVVLDGPTGYGDHPSIPHRLRTEFKIHTFDLGEAGGEVRHGHVAEEGADDVVSETIRSHGVWEPPETILVLDYVSSSLAKRPFMVDVGAQVGWFSLLAGSRGWSVLAIDGNDTALLHLQASWLENDFEQSLRCRADIVDANFDPEAVSPLEDTIGLLKIDVEGNEKHAIDAFGSWIDERRIGRILMEVSPVFNKSYPAILWQIRQAGYEVWVIPDKQHPALDADDVHQWLSFNGKPLHLMTKKELTGWVNAQHQFNVWCIAP